MSPLSGRAARSLAAFAAVLTFAAPPLSARAQPAGIDFSRSVGEDSLLGGGSGAGSPVGWRDTTPGTRSGPRGHKPSYQLGYERRSPSVFVVQARPRPAFTRGTGIFANANPGGGSVVYLSSRRSDGPSFGTDGPRFIDVAAERLDRQPIGPNGISIHRVGSAKIIRIAQNASGEGRASHTEKDMAPLPAPAPVEPAAVLAPPTPSRAAPAEDAAPPAEPLEEAVPAATVEEDEEAARSLEPWTDEWLNDCVARHDSFDASLGTYIGEDGRRRFCTGEPG